MRKRATVTKAKYVLYSHTYQQFLGAIFEYYISTLHWFMWKRVQCVWLAYSRAYFANFLADACRQQCIGIQAQRVVKTINIFIWNHFLQLFFKCLHFWRYLWKVRKIWAQTANFSIFLTDAFLLKLFRIDVQQAEVTKKHIFKHIFAILGGSLQIFLPFMIFVSVL